MKTNDSTSVDVYIFDRVSERSVCGLCNDYYGNISLISNSPSPWKQVMSKKARD